MMSRALHTAALLESGRAGYSAKVPARAVAIFLSNLPEGLSSSAGMRKAGRPEPFAETHNWAGLIAVLGFLTSFALSQVAG
jgi:hypothetical protein